MSARATPSGNIRRPSERAASADSVRPAELGSNSIAKPLLLPSRQKQPMNGKLPFNARAFLAKAGVGKKIVSLKKNETAYVQGDPADAIYFVQTGRLRVTVTSTNGKEATITLVGPGEFVGENCMISAHPLHLATATAMLDTDLLKVGKAEMLRVLHDEPKLSEMFTHFLLSRNARIQADLVDQLFNSSEKRLARILLLLAQFGKESKPETVVPKISQEVLAEMIGTTRSRVSFFMNRFRKLGFIEYNGKIRVHNTLLNIFLQE
jgi:CRP/FNR family transcriptional regulator, cyclic AMP receptor protein